MQKDLLTAQLANIVDRLIFYAIPLHQWDGKNFPEDLPPASEIEDSSSRILSKEFNSIYVIPKLLLDELAKIALDLEDFM